MVPGMTLRAAAAAELRRREVLAAAGRQQAAGRAAPLPGRDPSRPPAPPALVAWLRRLAAPSPAAALPGTRPNSG